MAEQLRDLAEKGDLDVVTARASDYFGPRGTAQSPLGDLVIGAALLANRPASSPVPTSPAVIPLPVTLARCLAAIGTREHARWRYFPRAQRARSDHP